MILLGEAYVRKIGNNRSLACHNNSIPGKLVTLIIGDK